MKKTIIVLLGVLVGSGLFAQFDFGLRFSANYPYQIIENYQVSVDAIEDLDNITGHMAGVFIGTSFGNLGVRLEANAPLENFSLARLIDGDQFVDVMSDTKFNYRYLNTVLMAHLELDLTIIKPYVGAGLNFGMPIEDLLTGDASINPSDFDVSRLGYAFSAGMVLFELIDVDIRYTTGMTDLASFQLIKNGQNFGRLVRLSLGLHIY